VDLDQREGVPSAAQVPIVDGLPAPGVQELREGLFRALGEVAYA
jgi:hypothetical protein